MCGTYLVQGFESGRGIQVQVRVLLSMEHLISREIPDSERHRDDTVRKKEKTVLHTFVTLEGVCFKHVFIGWTIFCIWRIC